MTEDQCLHLKSKLKTSHAAPASKPPPAPPAPAKEPGTTSQAAAPAQAAQANQEAIVASKKEQVDVRDDLATTGSEIENHLDDATKEGVRGVNSPAARSQQPVMQAANKDLNVINNFNRNASEGKRLPVNELNKVTNPKIRDHLLMAAANQDVQQRLQVEEKKIDLRIGELMKLAAVTLQSATAMNSVNSKASDPASSTNLNRSAKPNRGLASVDADTGISEQQLADDAASNTEKSKSLTAIKNKFAAEEVADAESATISNSQDEKIKSQIAEAIKEAEKRKKILALKKSLKGKLKPGETAPGKATTDATNTDALFAGKLGADSAALASDTQADKNESVFNDPVFQAAQSSFGLAGQQTDEEVSRMVSEAERELASIPDSQSALYGDINISIFARVKQVHDTCVRQECVSISLRSK